MRRPDRHTLAVAAVAALAFVAGACGGGGDDDDTGGAADGPARGETHTIDLEARDFSFAPATLTAPPGASVTVTVRNTGDAPHTFTAESVGVDEQVAAGETGEATFTMPESGSLAFVCTIHESQGMVGSVDPA